MKNTMQSIVSGCRGVVVAASMLLLAACATSGPRTEDLATRVQGRWDKLLAGDFAGAYQYLSPGYRSSVTSHQYERRLLLQKVRWESARYIDSECLEESCKVSISLDLVLLQAVPGVQRYEITQTAEEDWIRSGGQWWYVPEK
jgi:hypothetical protein